MYNRLKSYDYPCKKVGLFGKDVAFDGLNGIEKSQSLMGHSTLPAEFLYRDGRRTRRTHRKRVGRPAFTDRRDHGRNTGADAALRYDRAAAG